MVVEVLNQTDETFCYFGGRQGTELDEHFVSLILELKYYLAILTIPAESVGWDNETC